MSRGNEGPAVAPVAGHGAFRAAAERPPCFSAAGPTEQAPALRPSARLPDAADAAPRFLPPDLLCNLANNLASFPPKLVPAAPGGGPLGSRCHDQVRRAAVSAVLRVRPREEDRRAADEAWAAVGGTHPAGREDVHRFLQRASFPVSFVSLARASRRFASPPRSRRGPWVRRGTPEILFIKRATRAGDRWSGHVAFPGGKQEPSETARQTAERETREELGLDLTVG
ncbi:MAG: hypothetical protein BJ554DRAFT_1822 [Olpidium bornovanus]|uniref:Nudix hydrolase domain-containing protein n=1 Tax=Olpidium bornovanus TaxID=278681 RepID=A0A8H7ZR41_9FUNG|nr:MAG: hypothetical protein BJ554DRAFT_1822 [Olpidium bornovanus]